MYENHPRNYFFWFCLVDLWFHYREVSRALLKTLLSYRVLFRKYGNLIGWFPSNVKYLLLFALFKQLLLFKRKQIVKVTLFWKEIKLPGVNRKDFAISIQQKCDEFHKLRRTNVNFDEIALNFKNLVPNTTSFQLFNYVHTFPQLKNIFLWLEIERLGNSRLCFLSNEIRSNVNANYWIKNERNSSEELFLWFWLAYLI